jgi:hypothetical protein
MEIKWKQLKTIKGTAVNVPKFLEEILTRENERHALHDWQDIKTILVKKGEWVSSAAPVIRTLLSQFDRSKFPEYILFLIADIVAADCNDLWLTQTKTEPEANLLLKNCLDAVSENISILFNSLNSNRRHERAGAAIVMGSTLGYGSWELKALENQFAVETDPLVKACLLCSLELVDKSSRWSSEVQRIAQEGDPQPLVHGMATLCWLRSDANNDLDKVFQGVEAWLRTEPGYCDYLPFQRLFHNGHFTKVLAEALNKQTASNRINVLKALINLGNKVTHEKAVNRLGDVIDLVLGRNPEEKPRVIPANELDEEHRLVAEGLVDSWVYPKARWMPAAGSTRRRWLGVDEPSILELPAPEGIDSKKPSRPLWQVFLELDENRDKNQLMPEVIKKAFGLYHQWWIMAVMHGNSYGITELVDWGVLEKCGRELVVDDEVEKTIHMLCRDALIRRFLPGLGGGNIAISRLLLLPLVLSKRTIPEEFYSLILYRNEEVEREILKTIPHSYLVPVIVKKLDKVEPRWALERAKDYLPFVDIVPDPLFCEALIRIRSIMPAEKAEKYYVLLKEKAEIVPELKLALSSTLVN